MQKEQFRFVEEWRQSGVSFAELCRCFSVSRKTGYKWIGRYESGGLEALRDQSRAPKQQAKEVLPEVAQSVIAARHAHPTWGPVKLRAVLQREAPEIQWPVESTIGEILKRQGLTVRRVKRERATPNARPTHWRRMMCGARISRVGSGRRMGRVAIR